MKGRPATLSRGLAVLAVRGNMRVPSPAASTRTCISPPGPSKRRRVIFISVGYWEGRSAGLHTGRISRCRIVRIIAMAHHLSYDDKNYYETNLISPGSPPIIMVFIELNRNNIYEVGESPEGPTSQGCQAGEFRWWIARVSGRDGPPSTFRKLHSGQSICPSQRGARGG